MGRPPSAVWSPIENEWLLRVPGRRHLTPRADSPQGRGDPVRCPFCPGESEAPGATGVAIVPSRHPMVVASSREDGAAEELHWVVAYGDSHAKRLGDLPVAYTVKFLDEVSRVSSALMSLSAVRAVFAFESVGDHFGPTVAHPHGQVVGLPFIPRRLGLTQVGDRCVLCDVARDKSLEIVGCGTAALYVPPWARFPYEMVAMPSVHLRYLHDLRPVDIRSLAETLHTALRLCRRTFRGEMPPYLINIMAAARDDFSHHLRVEILPLHKDLVTLKRPGGMEIGLGVYLNPLPPESAVSQLRSAL